MNVTTKSNPTSMANSGKLGPYPPIHIYVPNRPHRTSHLTPTLPPPYPYLTPPAAENDIALKGIIHAATARS